MEDKGVINARDLRDLVIIPTLKEMDKLWPGAYTPQAVNLLVGVAYKESLIDDPNDGIQGRSTHLKQLSGPALGIYQIEPATHDDNWITYLNSRPDKAEYMHRLMRPRAFDSPQAFHEELVDNLRYATAQARLKFWRREIAWPTNPKDIEALGVIWDQAYNANPNKGTVTEFVKQFPKFIL
jgi:hypothetical protein